MDLHWFNSKIILEEKEIQFRKGFWLTLILSSIILFVFYQQVLLDINNVYFSKSGDGLQSYFSTIYQVKYDSTYWRMNGMNYPYGESSFFTSNQPLLTAFIKLISNNFYDISDYSIGIINLLMLLSIVVCAVSLFLIFNFLHLHWAYSAIVAVGIAFLSPQVQRMGGHYSLAYPFAIPLFILLLLKFYENATIKRTLAIALLIFIMAATHLYFLGIFALMLLIFYIVNIIKDENPLKNLRFSVIHFSIQVILPFIAVWLLIHLNDNVTDRSQNPWGFLYYRSAWEGVFLPIGRPIGELINDFIGIRHVEWEGIAFVGHATTLFSLILLFFFFKYLFQWKLGKIFNITPVHALNAVFWSSIVGLLYSFGIPFIFNLEFLLDYMGIFKQMRGIARFSWVFFYTANIIAFYLLYLFIEKRKKYIRILFLSIPVALLFYDAWFSIRSHEFFLNNKIPKLSGNIPEYESLLKNIEKDKYQAIIPLPVFAIGSENVWISSDEHIIKETLILSLKTGIPTIGSLLSRTSLSQTYKHMQMVQEPYNVPAIFEDIEDQKPFLVLTREQLLSETEKRFLNECNLYSHTADFTLYVVSSEAIKNYSIKIRDEVKDEINKTKLYSLGEFRSSDSLVNYYYNDFESTEESISYSGKGSYKGNLRDASRFYDASLPLVIPGEQYVASFWFYGFNRDVYPRASMEVAFVDTIKNQSRGEYKSLNKCIKIIDGDWALVEYDFIMPDSTHRLQFTMWNEEVDETAVFYADDFLLRPVKNNLYKMNGNIVYKNNRYYKLGPG